MITTNKKNYGRYTKVERKEHKHNTKENHQTTREETKRRKEQRRTTTRKQQNHHKPIPIKKHFKYP